MINTFAASLSALSASFGMTPEQFQILLGVLAVWTIPWKGVALWKSATQKEKWWFIILLVINTIGILEILYIFVFSKKRAEPSSPTN